MQVDELVIDGGLRLGDAIARASQIVADRVDRHDAARLLAPLVERTREARDSLQTAIDENRELATPFETLVELFSETVKRLLGLAEGLRVNSLVTRGCDYERLFGDVEALHREIDGSGDLVGGLDRIFHETGRLDALQWRDDLEAAKRDYERALRDAIDASVQDMETDEELARETVLMLQYKKAQGHWSLLAEQFWDCVRPLVPKEVTDVPAWYIPRSAVEWRDRPFARGACGDLSRKVGGFRGCGQSVLQHGPG